MNAVWDVPRHLPLSFIYSIIIYLLLIIRKFLSIAILSGQAETGNFLLKGMIGLNIV